VEVRRRRSVAGVIDMRIVMHQARSVRGVRGGIDLAGQSCDGGAQWRQLVLDDRPDEVVVDLEVAVHEDVTHPDDLSPRNVRLLIASLLGEPAGCLTDDL
jgi:hypothetical protein